MAMPTDIGIVDLGIGFPYTSVEQKMHAYDFFRANLKDAQSQQEMEFPVQYMFKGVPDVVDEGTDVVEWVVEKMDAFDIRIARRRAERERTRSAPPSSRSVRARHVGQPERRHRRAPSDGGGEGRARHRVNSMVFPSGCVPQVGIDSPLMYPVYTKCVELDIPMCINGGIVGPAHAELAAGGLALRRGLLRLPRAAPS